MSNRPVQQITVPSGLLAWLLLIPLRGQKQCQKQAVIPDWGRSEIQMRYFSASLFILLLGTGCATRHATPNNIPVLLSGRCGAIELSIPCKANSFYHHAFPTYDHYSIGVTNLGKELLLTVEIRPEKIDLLPDIQTRLNEGMKSMREIYENPQLRHVDTAIISNTSVPIIESIDGTGDNELYVYIPEHDGSVTILITAQGNDDVSQHAPFLKQLLKYGSIPKRHKIKS